MKYIPSLLGLLGGVVLIIISPFRIIKNSGIFLIVISLILIFLERFVFLEEYESSRLSQKKEARE